MYKSSMEIQSLYQNLTEHNLFKNTTEHAPEQNS